MANYQDTKDLRADCYRLISIWEDRSYRTVDDIDLLNVIKSINERLEIVEEHIYGVWCKKTPKEEQ